MHMKQLEQQSLLSHYGRTHIYIAGDAASLARQPLPLRCIIAQYGKGLHNNSNVKEGDGMRD